MRIGKYEEGLALARTGRYAEAISLFRDAVKENSTAEHWNDLGACQFAIGLTDAELSFREALSLDPMYTPALLNLGILLAKQKRHSEALPLLDRAHSILGENGPPISGVMFHTCRQKVETGTAPGISPDRAEHPRILFLATNFGLHGFSEANSSEAWHLYAAIRKVRPAWQAEFVSAEHESAKRQSDQEQKLELVPLSSVPDAIRRHQPDLLHVIYPLLKFPPPEIQQNFSMVLTVTAADPTEHCMEADLEEIRHLIDFGRLAVVCESEGSMAILQRAGIRVAAMIPPIVPLHRVVAPGATNRSYFTCGFATAPFLREHWESRGVDMLLDLAKLSPEVQFRIAWRTSLDEIERDISVRNLKNVSVRTGRLDMKAFYKDIDIILLPFGKVAGNHASPLSAVEGMFRGKPVLATKLAGISQWIADSGAGVVTEPTPEALRNGLLQLLTNFRTYSEQAFLASRKRFNSDANAAAYLPIYCEMLQSPKGPTLDAWEENLHESGGELVRGREPLARYYTQKAVATGYMANRFVTPPFDQLHEQELAAIEKLIHTRFGERTGLQLLDLASGTGRLLPALLPFGSVTAFDGSDAMLNASELPAGANVRKLVGDVFEFPIDEKFHVITCGRFLRHFSYPDRQLLYRRFRTLLRDDGIVIVDVPDPRFEHAFRDKAGWEKFGVYDVFWTLPSFRDELRRNGLRLAGFERVGVGLRLFEGQQKIEDGS